MMPRIGLLLDERGRSALLSVFGCCLLSNYRVLLGALSLELHDAAPEFG